jgi:hypothetical protein
MSAGLPHAAADYETTPSSAAAERRRRKSRGVGITTRCSTDPEQFDLLFVHDRVDAQLGIVEIVKQHERRATHRPDVETMLGLEAAGCRKVHQVVGDRGSQEQRLGVNDGRAELGFALRKQAVEFFSEGLGVTYRSHALSREARRAAARASI